jgi:hypothetical protein
LRSEKVFPRRLERVRPRLRTQRGGERVKQLGASKRPSTLRSRIRTWSPPTPHVSERTLDSIPNCQPMPI